MNTSTHSEKLVNIIDVLLSQPMITEEQSKTSGASFLSYILPAFSKRMFKNATTNDIETLTKIFQVISRLYVEQPRALEKSNNHIVIVDALIPFFNRVKFPAEIVEQSVQCLTTVIHSYSQVADLRTKRYLAQQKKVLIKHLEFNLTKVLNAYTNSNQETKEYDSITQFEDLNKAKISELSKAIRILSIFLDPLTYEVLSEYSMSPFLLESNLAKCWFCLKSLVVNDSFHLKDSETVELYDELHAKLLQITTNYFFNDSNADFTQLQLVILQCKFLLTWSLLSLFPSTHIILSESLLKIVITLTKSNNLQYFWSNLKLNNFDFVQSLLEKKLHIDLKTTISYIFIGDCRLTSADQLPQKLLKLSKRKYEFEVSSLWRSKTEQLWFPHTLQDFNSIHEFNRTTTVNEYLTYWRGSKSILDPLFRIKILNTMSKLCCNIAGHLSDDALLCLNCDKMIVAEQNLTSLSSKTRPSILENDEMRELYNFFLEEFISKMGQLDDADGNLTITTIGTLKYFFVEFRNPELGDILWKFILNCFSNVFREIRLLIVQIIPLTIHCIEDDQYDIDLQTILSFIQSITPDESNSHLFEGLIVLLSELLSIKSIDTSYHLLLSKLIEFMSDTDEFRVDVSVIQLRKVACSKGTSTWKVIEPFISPISVKVAENVTTKPSLLTNLCISLGMPEWLFLEKTSTYTVPVLFHKMKNASLNIMVGKMKKNHNQRSIQKVKDLVSQELICVVAHTLVVTPKNGKSKLMKLLVASQIITNEMDFGDLMEEISPQLPLLIFRILLFYSKVDSDRISRIVSAISEIADTLNYGSENSSRETSAFAMLDRWLLTLIQLISTTISDLKGSQPFLLKLYSMRALVCLSDLCPSFETCINQVMNCIQVALQYPELQKEAILCWEQIFNKFSTQSKIYVLDPIICQLFLKWDSFTPKIQSLSISLITKLHQWCSSQDLSEIKYWFSTYTSVIDKIPILKSLHVPLCRRIDILYNARKKLRSDNQWVAEQALDILINVLSADQRDIQTELLKMKNSQRTKLFLMDILQYIINGGLVRFKVMHVAVGSLECDNEAGSRISYKAAQVLSLIGNIGVNHIAGGFTFNKSSYANPRSNTTYNNVDRFLLVTTLSPTPNSEQELVLNNFHTYFVQNVLVKLLITSINPDQQKLLACTIHDYLKLCDVSQLKYKTEKLDPLTANILSPLKTELASLKKKRIANLAFPIYEEYREHNEWMQKLSAIMLYNVDDLLTKQGILSGTASNILNNIPHLDHAVSKFVLPYALLTVITYSSSSSDYIEPIINEFFSVLNQSKENIYYEFVKEEWKKCVVTILELFQFLRAWIYSATSEAKQTRIGNSQSMINRVEKFLKKFDSYLIAERSIDCALYESAVFNLEKGYKDKEIDENIFSTQLKDMYVELEDYDQLQGVLKSFSTNNLNDMLLKFKYNEDQAISTQSLAAIAQFDFEEVDNNQSISKLTPKKSVTELLDGLDRICEYDELLLNLKNFEQKLSSYSEEVLNLDWTLYGLQGSIFTGDITLLKKWTSNSENFNSISVPGSELSIYFEIARGLISLYENETADCLSHIDNATRYIGVALLKTEKNTSDLLPKYMTLLHGLYDFKSLAQVTGKDDSLTNTLRLRQLNSTKEFRVIWKIHSLRASIYKLHPTLEFQETYRKCLIGGSRILRENLKLPQATKLLTKALVLNQQTKDKTISNEFALLISVEFSKLLWEQGDYQSALKKLSKVIETIDEKNSNYLSFQLTYLKWLVESSEGSSDIIREQYNVLIRNQSFNTESDVYYQFGNYLSKLLDAQKVDDVSGELDVSTVRMYMIAIGFADSSKQYIHEVFPKAITIWLDFFKKYNLSVQKQDSPRYQFHTKLNELIKTAIEGTEIGVKWYIVLSQVISRILHPAPAVVKNIQRIIVLLCKTYPSVILYSVFSLANSVMNKRQKAALEIMQQLQAIDVSEAVGFKHSKSVPFVGLMTKSYDLINKMARLCGAQLKDKKRRTIDLYKDLKFEAADDGYCPYLALPVKYNFDQLYKLNDSFEFITFSKFERKVNILSSLQCPKRVEILGSDGRRYFLLMKPNDDLRKDHKVTEFSNVMNNVLKKDYETQKRNMRIQSYAATPLSEKIGIIEWVQNYRTLRPIITKKIPKFMYLTKTYNDKLKDCKSDAERVNLFKEFKAKSPPVLSDWMIQVAPNVIHWYDFRAEYCSSLAVMSIVGYLVGIGDRHLDNIMISDRTGNIMHIDFDCIFEKGKNLGVPEVVPFRLTQNMIDGLGVLKWEGRYRTIAELTMSKMRQNENMLMNFLESFIYDPLLDWTKKTKDPSIQRDEVYSRLRNKIKGILTPDDAWTMYMDTSGLCVSANLQVDLLIQAATSDAHLSQMFYGWCPLA